PLGHRVDVGGEGLDEVVLQVLEDLDSAVLAIQPVAKGKDRLVDDGEVARRGLPDQWDVGLGYGLQLFDELKYAAPRRLRLLVEQAIDPAELLEHRKLSRGDRTELLHLVVELRLRLCGLRGVLAEDGNVLLERVVGLPQRLRVGDGGLGYRRIGASTHDGLPEHTGSEAGRTSAGRQA